MNKDLEKYIGELSPELQEKARACKTKEELNQFIADNDLELPEEALELVSGGCGTSSDKWYCNHCNTRLENEKRDAPYEPIPMPENNGPGFGPGTREYRYTTMYKYCPKCKINIEYSNMHR
ncbi:MAG: hypothetical protein IJ740_17485 [Ruminococcus sp.]|nr:hypothetical protein [Ruminococcus sp.]